MNKLNSIEPNNLNPPLLSTRLTSDTFRYRKLIKQLEHIYQPIFIDQFFSFLDIVEQQGTLEIQNNILENPGDLNQQQEFGMYMTIFEHFLNIYGDTIITSQTYNGFEQYKNIVFKAEIDYIRKTKQEIADLNDSHTIYQHYESYLTQYDFSFEDELEWLGSKIGFATALSPSSLNIQTIIDILGDIDCGWTNDMKHNLRFQHIIPYLLEHICVCQDFIHEKDQETIIKENADNCEEIYNEIIDHLRKQAGSIRLNIDRTLEFARPICTQQDFEERYAKFMTYLGSSYHNPQIRFNYNSEVYNKNINNNNIERIIGNEKVSLSEYFEERFAEYNDHFKDPDDDEDEHDSFTTYLNNKNEDSITPRDLDAAADMIGREMNNELNQSEYERQLQIIKETTNELSRYYLLNIHIGFSEGRELPSFTITADEYCNKTEEDGSVTTTQKSESTIIKPTFCIGDDGSATFDEYMQDMINFLDNLSPGYNCLEMLDISPPKDST